MNKTKWYVVWKGRTPGIYTTWAACKEQVDGFVGAQYKSFATREEADAAYAANVKVQEPNVADHTGSISVDVGSRGNPGIIEYKGVDTMTGEVLFAHPEIPKGTNNMGEFVAIVHALALIAKQPQRGYTFVYSDSMTALAWVRNREPKSSLPRDDSTLEMWTLVDRAVAWLKQHPNHAPVRKWNTAQWGEIRADYGRK